MKTISIHLATICILIVLLVSGCAEEQEEKIYHVGILSCMEFFYPISDGFKEGMTELGYIENSSIVYSVYEAPAEVDEEMEQVLQGFVADRVDLIVVAPTAASLKAKEVAQGTGVPVVFAAAFTEGTDLIDSVRVPGGNITGMRWSSSAELGVKYLELFHEMAPQASRLWIPSETSYPSLLEQLEAFRVAAEPLGLTLVEVPVQDVEDIQADLDARKDLSDIGIDAMIITNSPIAMLDGLETIFEFATEYNLPIVGREESTFSLSPEPFSSGKQAAYLADKILKGADAGTIPVVTAENTFIINYNMTQQLGLNVSSGLLARADKIIR